VEKVESVFFFSFSFSFLILPDGVEGLGQTNAAFDELHVDHLFDEVEVSTGEAETVLDVITILVGVSVSASLNGSFGGPFVWADVRRGLGVVACGPRLHLILPHSGHLGQQILEIIVLTTAEIRLNSSVNKGSVPDRVKVVIVSIVSSLDTITTTIGSECDVERLVNVTKEMDHELESVLGGIESGVLRVGQLIAVIEDRSCDAHIVRAICRWIVIARPVRCIDIMERCSPLPLGIASDLICPRGNCGHLSIVRWK